MHQIHVTDGVVLGKRERGEASTVVAIFTRELGLVRARAQSARVEKSKLRYGLEQLNRGRYSFVKGKHEWRLVGVEEVSRALLAPTIAERRVAGRIAKLLLRLMPGQGPEAALFDTVV